MNVTVCAVLVFICVTMVTANYPDDMKINLLKRLLISPPGIGSGAGGAKGGNCKNLERLEGRIDKLISLLEMILPEPEETETNTDSQIESPDEGTTPTTESQANATTAAESATTTLTPQPTNSATAEPDTEPTTAAETGTGTTDSDSGLERRVLLNLLKNLARKRTQLRH
ncbi:uncharacterized protein LOC123540714 isoform X2 [Mercenaria mercenaria]|uniref:uncharacterized protein LOC123540714 isoform X2 n=1 Tax=Mercenaria mercenaria TaxID=6596 RepID=UPI00234F7830|nr:uncharacterized protein LOC123540714 isoform X2 [Mercenaria mercenaria]